MKKAAPKTPKKLKKNTATPRVAKPKKESFVENYYRLTDEFFINHPHSRVLIGLFIVVFVMFVGLLFHDKAQAMGWKNTYYYYY